jgi:hypothetical protein
MSLCFIDDDRDTEVNTVARYLYIKCSKFVKNEHARYTVKYFPVDNARVIYTKGLNS